MKYLKLLLLCLLFPVAALADGWETQYKQIEQSIRQPKFADREFLVTKYGASPEASAADNQKAINKAIDACHKAGGGRVVVPAGTYNTGAITLKSNVNLEVQKGATLLFAFQPELYPIVPTRWEGLDCWNLSPCIYAYKATDVAITGEGTIDGGGTNETWWKWCGATHYGWKEGTISQRNGSRARLLKMAEDGVPMDERRFGPEDGLRPQLINFNQCDGILIENVTLLRSPFWVIHPLLSKNITVRGVHINNDGPNGDGCDPESCDGVLIENCFFNTGDDCIAMTCITDWNGQTENVIVSDCIFSSRSACVRVGHMASKVRNVVVSDVVMTGSNRGIAVFAGREGRVENVSFDNIMMQTSKYAGGWWGKGEPLVIVAYDGGTASGISVRNVRASSENSIIVYGEAVSDILLENWFLSIRQGHNLEHFKPLYELSPAPLVASPDPAVRIPYLCTDNISAITLDNVTAVTSPSDAAIDISPLVL